MNPTSTHINGLDAIRCICALAVLVAHLGQFPLCAGIDLSNPIASKINGLYNSTVSGPAAVIVFFVISGLCIHYPFRHGKRIRLTNFYLRRYIRTGIPLITALAISPWNSMDYVLWSLICEEIYYSLYPTLMLIKKRIGWAPFLSTAFCLSAIVITTNPIAGNYAAYGNGLNWLLGLPCWLLGCKLAEDVDDCLKKSPPSIQSIYQWRLIVWLISCVCLVLRWRTPIGYPWTLNFFAILVYFWFTKELPYLKYHSPSRLLEWAGRWSYSMYLMHFSIGSALHYLALPNFGYIINWTITTGLTLCGCYLFYVLIERPSHQFARRYRWV